MSNQLSRRRLAPAAIAVPVLLLFAGGCGGDAEPNGSDGAERDRMSLGETAEIGYYSYREEEYEKVGAGTVAVTGVREGTTAALEASGFDLEPDEAEKTPYYVDVSFTNEGPEPIEPASVLGESASGEAISALTLIDFGTSFDPCPGMPERIRPQGAAEGCAVLLAPPGAELTSVKYLESPDEGFLSWDVEG